MSTGNWASLHHIHMYEVYDMYTINMFHVCDHHSKVLHHTILYPHKTLSFLQCGKGGMHWETVKHTPAHHTPVIDQWYTEKAVWRTGPPPSGSTLENWGLYTIRRCWLLTPQLHWRWGIIVNETLWTFSSTVHCMYHTCTTKMHIICTRVCNYVC